MAKLFLASQLAGDLAVNFGPTAIEIVAQHTTAIGSRSFPRSRRSAPCADGKPQPFTYDAARRIVRLEGYRPHRLQITLSGSVSAK